MKNASMFMKIESIWDKTWCSVYLPKSCSIQ